MSQWNALLIQHYFSPFGTTQLKKTAKENRVVYLVIFQDVISYRIDQTLQAFFFQRAFYFELREAIPNKLASLVDAIAVSKI